MSDCLGHARDDRRKKSGDGEVGRDMIVFNEKHLHLIVYVNTGESCTLLLCDRVL